ncbi:Signal transduction histidine kinase [Marinobacter sp. LV10R510-11A]|uniref:histidine kinase dimerization/phospho-acceptor domain-containing protein n=1 Tax=Marinobacter sp. LV10R510-11A TaxID=1415568 RepID=UPI000BB69907|nr:histidine kinase dimerization/phospho-acceptor domain-containing protein [Marinobacter sp. LV10R510-11A]SOB75894.1 Signal transduction histidine kinase [Marinobacter sp. LV10R510-11A]
MSLRRRLLWFLGLSFVLLWLSVGLLMYLHLNQQVSKTLDQRLSSSANMVAGLIARQPEMLVATNTHPLLLEPESEGVACQIRAANGEVLLQTSGVRGTSLSDSRPGFSSRRIGEEEWRLYTLNQEGVFITTADRMSERTMLENSIILVMVVPFTLALLGSLAVLWWGIRGGLRPLQRLHDELRQRDPFNLEPVRIGDAPSELAPVVETLNGLLARVARTVAREQRFASDAAHEFRTPLTGIKTHLQVARRVTGDKQQLALANAEKGVVRMQRVTEQLLMLARLEQGNPWQEEKGSSVNDVLENALADIPDRRRLRVENRIASESVRVPLTLAAVALRNLVDNALKYSANECIVMIDKESNATPENPAAACFLVRDSGGPDRSDARWPVSEGRASALASHGLGLTIVETITTQYGGTLVATYNDAGGMDWLLRLPLIFKP